MAVSAAPFHIDSRIDRRVLASRFGRSGQVRIAPFLAAGAAESLRDHLLARSDWLQVIGDEARVFELDRTLRADFDAQRIAALDAAVYQGARDGFQFRFESIRVPDDAAARAALDSPLAAFATWMASDETIAFFREVTGDETIGFADAQATAYSAGDFLTAHDDAVEGKGRRAAYVFGLTPRWRLEWGGALTFHDEDGGFSGRSPGFNTLDLFRVPQVHSVSLVGPSAGETRFAVTGWLRERPGGE